MKTKRFSIIYLVLLVVFYCCELGSDIGNNLVGTYNLNAWGTYYYFPDNHDTILFHCYDNIGKLKMATKNYTLNYQLCYYFKNNEFDLLSTHYLQLKESGTYDIFNIDYSPKDWLSVESWSGKIAFQPDSGDSWSGTFVYYNHPAPFFHLENIKMNNELEHLFFKKEVAGNTIP